MSKVFKHLVIEDLDLLKLKCQNDKTIETWIRGRLNREEIENLKLEREDLVFIHKIDSRNSKKLRRSKKRQIEYVLF